MFKFSLTLKGTYLLIVFFAVVSILGCASTQFVPDADSEKWVGKISGMAEGDLKLFIMVTQGQSNLHSVSGPLTMNLKTTTGYGDAKVEGRIKGKIKSGNMNAKIFANVSVEGSVYQLSGKMVGTISKTQASGTWSLSHIEGSHSGKWTAERAAE